MSTIRGLVFHARFDYAKKHYPYEVRKKAQDLLSAKAQFLLSEQVFAVSNYEFDILVELDKALCEVSEENCSELYSKIGHQFAAKIMDRYFYNYIVEQEAERFVFQFERLYERLWGFGKLEVTQQDEQKYQLIFKNTSLTNALYDEFMKSFLTGALELCGAEKLTVKDETTDPEKNERTYFIQFE